MLFLIIFDWLLEKVKDTLRQVERPAFSFSTYLKLKFMYKKSASVKRRFTAKK